MAFVAPARRGAVDQIAQAVELIRTNPESRRIVVSRRERRRDRRDGPAAALLCHVLFQFYVAGGKALVPVVTSAAPTRSWRVRNIASYALLTLMTAQVRRGLEPGVLKPVHTLGDAHLYLNHMEQADEQLSREPRPLPVMRLNPDEIALRFPLRGISRSKATIPGRRSRRRCRLSGRKARAGCTCGKIVIRGCDAAGR